MKRLIASVMLLSLCPSSTTSGEVPGEVLPELEAQQPAAQSAPPAQAAPAQAPPDTEIYLSALKIANGKLELGAPVNITNSPGYDNQPSFTPDGAGILFTSVRGTLAGASGASTMQSDIYRYDIRTGAVSRLTQTQESEYSPTSMPDGRGISVVRVEADGTQRLWSVATGGPKVELTVLLPDVKPVGYHAWADDRTLALFVLGQPATLQLADTRTGTARTIASDIGRSLQRIPGTGRAAAISFVQRERDDQGVRLTIKRLNPATGEVALITPAVDGSREADVAWMPDGTLLMAKDGVLYRWSAGSSGWKEAASLQRLSLDGITRLAVSPTGDYLALVGSPHTVR